jgi:hypothetical protein
MANDRVMYIPWNNDEIGEFNNSGMDEFTYGADYNNTQKPTSHHKRTWSVVYANSPAPALASLGIGWGTRLHLAGHGQIGDANVYPPHASTAAQPISYQQVVAAMMASGLKTHYIGTIVCDVCYSALGNPPFARLLARELWSHGYKATCVMGFKGSLQSAYVDNASGGVAGKYTHRVVDTAKGTIKSKDAKVRFFGFK